MIIVLIIAVAVCLASEVKQKLLDNIRKLTAATIRFDIQAHLQLIS